MREVRERAKRVNVEITQAADEKLAQELQQSDNRQTRTSGGLSVDIVLSNNVEQIPL